MVWGRIVVGKRVEAAVRHEVGKPRTRPLRIEMQLAETGGAHDFARLVQLCLDPPGVVAALRAEIRGVVDREEEPAVLPPVLRLVEIVLRGIADEPEELLLRMGQGHEHAALLAELRTELVAPFVVAPHERELHPAAVQRPEEPLLQRLLLRDFPVVPVIVVQEDIDTRICRKRNLLRHVLGVGPVEITGVRHHRLFVVGIESPRVLYECPLSLLPIVGAKPLVALWIPVPMRIINADNFNLLRAVI